jgi:hypothetical protein
MGRGVSKNVRICVTSLMDDPFVSIALFFFNILFNLRENDEKLSLFGKTGHVFNLGRIIVSVYFR